MENVIIFDWLSFTSKIDNPDSIKDLLGLGEVVWTPLKGANGYQDRLYYDHISIHYNGREDMGVWCEMSGRGCRAFESYGHGDYMSLFDIIFSNKNKMRITRLDIAYDDHTGILDMNQMCSDVLAVNYVSNFSNWLVVQSSEGSSILHGSRKSEILIRIYDKAMEKKIVDQHWIRVEIQLRRERAENFISNYCHSTDDIGRGFSGILNTYLRYVTPSENDSNKRRWKTADYWQQLLTTSQKIKLYTKPGTDYSLQTLENYVIKQAGNAVDTYISIIGIKQFITNLKERYTSKNPKYELLKEKHLALKQV